MLPFSCMNRIDWADQLIGTILLQAHCTKTKAERMSEYKIYGFLGQPVALPRAIYNNTWGNDQLLLWPRARLVNCFLRFVKLEKTKTYKIYITIAKNGGQDMPQKALQDEEEKNKIIMK